MGTGASVDEVDAGQRRLLRIVADLERGPRPVDAASVAGRTAAADPAITAILLGRLVRSGHLSTAVADAPSGLAAASGLPYTTAYVLTDVGRAALADDVQA